MPVVNLPLIPEHIQKINTPRRTNNVEKMEAYNARSDQLVGLARSTALQAAREQLSTELKVTRDHLDLQVAANLEQMRSETRELAKRMVTTHDFASQRQETQEILHSLSEQLDRVQRERDVQGLALTEVRTALENIIPVLEQLHGRLPVPVRFTPLEWVMIILSFGLYRPTKNPP